MATFAVRSAEVAQPLDGPWARGVRTIAAELGIAVVVGMFTPGSASIAPDGRKRRRVRNTLLAAGPTLDTHYDKMHLYDAWGFVESRHVEPGQTPCAIDLNGVKIGLTTCYEVRFPEVFKFHATHGASIVLVPTSWANGPGKIEQWRTLCIARALDSTCFIAAAAQADPATEGFEVKPGAPTGVGHSVVVGPLGEILAEGGDAAELIVVDLDTESIPDARARLPVLATSRFSIAPPG